MITTTTKRLTAFCCFNLLTVSVLLTAFIGTIAPQDNVEDEHKKMPRSFYYDLRAVARKLNVAFTVEDVESSLSPMTTRGLGSRDAINVPPPNAPSLDELSEVVDLGSAVKLLEGLLPEYIVAVSPTGVFDVRVLHVIHRDLIIASPMSHELKEYSFTGTFTDLAKTDEKKFFGVTINTGMYSPSGSINFVLDDSHELKISKYSGSIRELFTKNTLACRPESVILWRTITAQMREPTRPTRLEIFPNGGGKRLR